MGYDAWLEQPYVEDAEAAEGEEWAEEHGYGSLEEYLEDLYAERADRKIKENKEENLF